jgi:hypothetical protein
MSRKMPSVEVNNYTSIFTSPIFKDQNGEWYRDVGYEDSLDIIRDNFHGVRKSFVAIGYYLKHIRENELYKEGNHQNIWECAKEEFGLSQPAASNYMAMNDAFSKNGNTPLLDDKYADFNKSQLQEMLALPDELKEEIKPQQTVTEIRKIVKEEKKGREPSEADIKKFYEIHAKNYDDDRNKLKELLIQYLGKGHSGGNSGGLNYQCSPRGVKIGSAEEITWANLIKLINLYILPKVKPQPEPLNIEGQTDPDEWQLPGQMSVQDYPELMPDKIPNDMELKLCPFCGGTAMVHQFANPKNYYYVECTDCNCRTDGFIHSKTENTDEENIKANVIVWNKRVI